MGFIEGMAYNAATVNAPAPAVSAKDIGRKKKSTRTAKLKQCKLDARREQWLSQVKFRGCKVSDEHVPASPLNPSSPIGDGSQRDKLNTRPTQRNSDVTEPVQDSDLDSPVNSPGSTFSRDNYVGEFCPVKGGSSHSSRSSCGTYSRSISEAEEEEQHSDKLEGNLDDWEAVADALMTTSDAQQESERHAVQNEPLPSHNPHNDFSGCDNAMLKNPEPMTPVPMAWRPDDALRPRTLPSLSKHRSFPLNKNRYIGQGWMNEILVDQPLSCPVCCEDLDNTDSSFLPCNCGFHLCLFCHKRILEADGRCPGCRKQYGSVMTGESIQGEILPGIPARLSRVFSMGARS